jgi:Inorganic pyrophosphatase
MSVEQIVLYSATGAGALTVLYAWWLARWIDRQAKGDAKMNEIALAIQQGAAAYLNRQYRTIALGGDCGFRSAWAFCLTGSWRLGFLAGAVLSGLSGWIGMKISR